MKTRLILCLFILVLLLGVFPLAAQELPKGDIRNNDFMTLIEKIKAENHITVPLETRMPVGTEYKLPDGTSDKLVRGDNHGVWGHEFSKFYGITYEQFLLDKKIPVRAENVAIVSPPTEETGLARWYKQDVVIDSPPYIAKVDPWYMNPIVIMILLAFLIAAIAQLIRRRRGAQQATVTREREAAEITEHQRLLHRTPAEVGPPMVQGGIPPTDRQRLENFFDQQATARFVELNPNYRGIENPVRIGPLQHGNLQGHGETRDLNGIWHELIVPAPGRPGYQARYRYPDATEEDLQAWQECMNIVRQGGGMRGLTFTPFATNGTVVETPQPPSLIPVAVLPAAQVAGIKTAAEAVNASTILVGGDVMEVQQGAHFDLDSVPGAVVINGRSFKITTELKRTRAKAQKPRKSGTA